MIETVTIAANSFSDAYYFQIEISRIDLLKLQEERLFGIPFKKNKYKFLNDLRDVITDELIKHFHALIIEKGEI